MKTHSMLVAGVGLVAMTLTACSSSGGSGTSGAPGDTSTASGSGPKASRVLVGYASPVQAEPSVSLIGVGMKNAAGTLGWKVNVLDSNLNPSQQVTNIQTLIQQHAAAVASWTLDSGATSGIYGQAEDAGIPIIGVNSEGAGVKVSAYAEIQQCEANGTAQQTAAMFAKAHPHGKIITIGLDSVPSWVAVDNCFGAAARKAGLTVVAHVSNETDDSAGASKLVQTLLTKYPDVDAIWAYNDASALGASAALVSAGKQISDGSSEGVMVVGENGDTDAIQAVRDRRLTGTWDINSVQLGWLIIKVMNDEINHEPVPSKLILKSTFWTRQNIAKYVAPQDRQVTFSNLDLVE